MRQLVAEYGQKKWALIASKLGTKGSKQVGVILKTERALPSRQTESRVLALLLVLH